MLRSAVAFFVLSAVAVAADGLRLDFAHPVEGETMRISIERARPNSEVSVLLTENGSSGATLQVVADGAGSARIDWVVERGAAGHGFWLVARNDGQTSEPAHGTFQLPQLLVTGSSADGQGYLLRIPVDQSANPFTRLLARVPLGLGIPGGAVRDARGIKTYVVADRERGTMRVVYDDPQFGAPTLNVPDDIRGLAITEDGRRMYVVAGGSAPDRSGVLVVIDAQTDRILERLPLDPLGEDGGKIVLTPDGFRAFVSVRGLYVREVNLRRLQLGALVAVGEPGQERIADLRVVGGHVYALSAGKRERDSASLTSVVVANLRDAFQLRGLAGASGMGVGSDRSDHVLFVLDGQGGEVTVLDADTLERRRSFQVPAGADALLLPPNDVSDRGAVLYRVGFERTDARWFSADGVSDGPALELPWNAQALPVQGSARSIDWMFVADQTDLLAFRSDAVDTVRIPLAMAAAVLSIGR